MDTHPLLLKEKLLMQICPLRSACSNRVGVVESFPEIIIHWIERGFLSGGKTKKDQSWDRFFFRFKHYHFEFKA